MEKWWRFVADYRGPWYWFESLTPLDQHETLLGGLLELELELDQTQRTDETEDLPKHLLEYDLGKELLVKDLDRVQLGRSHLEQVSAALYSAREALKFRFVAAGVEAAGQTHAEQLLLALQKELDLVRRGGRSAALSFSTYEPIDPRTSHAELWTLRREALAAVVFLSDCDAAKGRTGRAMEEISEFLTRLNMSASKSALKRWRKQVQSEIESNSYNARNYSFPESSGKATIWWVQSELYFHDSGAWGIDVHPLQLPLSLQARSLISRDCSLIKTIEQRQDRLQGWTFYTESTLPADEIRNVAREICEIVLTPLAIGIDQAKLPEGAGPSRPKKKRSHQRK